jgi:hypothetical protein
VGVQSPFTFQRGPAILETVLAASWAATANEDTREVFRAARKQMQADLRFMVLFSGLGRLSRAYHAKPVQAGGLRVSVSG